MTAKIRSIDTDQRERVREALEARLRVLESLPSDLDMEARARLSALRRANLERQLGLRPRSVRASAPPVSPDGPVSPERNERVLALHALGLTYTRIADELGITVSSVGNVIYRARRSDRAGKGGAA